MGRGAAKQKTWLGVWRDLPAATRLLVAETAFEHPKIGKALTVALARHDRVRRQTAERWSVSKRAQHVARMRRLPNAKIAAALFTQFHLARRDRLVVAFLDFLKIPHAGGLIANIESLEPPNRSRMVAAIRRMVAAFPRQHASLFFDIISCQSGFPVFADFDDARLEALPDEHRRYDGRPSTPVDTFGGRLDDDLAADDLPPAPPDPEPRAW